MTRDMKAWNALRRFTSPEDRKPITENTHGADKLRRVVHSWCGCYEWQKVDAIHSPAHLVVGASSSDEDHGHRLLLLKDGQRVPSFDTPNYDYKPFHWPLLPLPIKPIKRVAFAMMERTGVHLLLDGVFIDPRAGTVLATDMETVCVTQVDPWDAHPFWVPASVAKGLDTKEEWRYASLEGGCVTIKCDNLWVMYRYHPIDPPALRILNPGRPRGRLIDASRPALLATLKEIDSKNAKVWIDFETGLMWNDDGPRTEQPLYTLDGGFRGSENRVNRYPAGVTSDPYRCETDALAWVSLQKLVAALKRCETDAIRLESGGQSLLTIHSGPTVTHVSQLRRKIDRVLQ